MLKPENVESVERAFYSQKADTYGDVAVDALLPFTTMVLDAAGRR